MNIKVFEPLREMAMLEAARVPLKGWQRAAVSIGAFIGAARDPGRADLVHALAETTGQGAFEKTLERMKNCPEGMEILRDRPRVISSTVEHLYDMPPNTFGGTYAKFMGKRNFSPDDRTPVRFCDTDDLAYVVMRSREAHDIWHTLFNLNTNLIGETALKLIEFEQMQIPMGALGFVAGSARLNEKQRKLFFSHYFPWAVKAGLQATDLMSVYYEKYWEEDVEEVRRKWGIIPAPPPPKQD
ncbi:hypothetical protein LIER_34572 [Lithospermum erythrorhizon]|uniref:Ubiquinone biosynthesis protein COQ4 homolog, mitochondrial n=1 Tax=Lithospermum erythrorhizon TaxID=34254 RepID=A0AAV3S0P0_LITER